MNKYDFLDYKSLINKVNNNKRLIRNNESIIYCLIKDNEIVYIGQSTEFLERLSKHNRDKRGLFDSYAVIENLGVDFDYQKLLSREKYYIKMLKPKLNKAHVQRKKKRKRKSKPKCESNFYFIRSVTKR